MVRARIISAIGLAGLIFTIPVGIVLMNEGIVFVNPWIHVFSTIAVEAMFVIIAIHFSRDNR